MNIEDSNYYSDSRVAASYKSKWYVRIKENSMTAIVKDYDGNTREVEFEYEVCPTCQGRGKHVNPSIDASGLSSEDFAEDPDFATDYLSGLYDVSCYECGGKRVVPVTTDEEVLRSIEEERAYKQERLAEMRMGA